MKKIYYGWILLPFATLGVIMSIPGQTAGFSAFTEPLLGFSGISRTALSSAYLLGTMISGFILPFMGKVVDRLGSRIMMTLAALCMGLTLWLMSQVDHGAQWLGQHLPFLDMKAIYFGCFVLGVFCLRFFGQGMLPLSSNTMVGKWFEKYRGPAVAVMGAANSLAFANAPTMMNALVKATDWSQAWLILAGVIGMGMSLIALLFYRKNPESCGLHVDGIKPDKIGDGEESVETLEGEIQGIPLKQARSTLIFWLFGISMGLFAMIYTGFTFHILAIGEQAKMLDEKALSIFIFVSFISVPISIIASWLSGRFSPVWYLRALCFGEILGFVSIFFLNSPLGFVLSLIGLGIAAGFMGPSMTTMMPKIFGRKYLGAILAAIASMIVIGSSIGPLYLSLVRDISGLFTWGILLSCIIPLAVMGLSFLLGQKRLLKLA